MSKRRCRQMSGVTTDYRLYRCRRCSLVTHLWMVISLLQYQGDNKLHPLLEQKFGCDCWGDAEKAERHFRQTYPSLVVSGSLHMMLEENNGQTPKEKKKKNFIIRQRLLLFRVQLFPSSALFCKSPPAVAITTSTAPGSELKGDQISTRTDFQLFQFYQFSAFSIFQPRRHTSLLLYIRCPVTLPSAISADRASSNVVDKAAIAVWYYDDSISLSEMAEKFKR